MTPAEEAAEVAASPEFAASPGTVIGEWTGWAADAYSWWWRWKSPLVPPEEARRFVHVACALVALADNPNVQRGVVLDTLVETYGDGLS